MSIFALSPRRGRAWAAPLALAVALGGQPAAAHQLNVFAYVCTDIVVVEIAFSNGNNAVAGAVRVFDGTEKLLLTTSVSPDGFARFPLADYETGLLVDVDAGEGHTSYWILTPEDIAAQLAAPYPECAA